jgi:hypothetical protein
MLQDLRFYNEELSPVQIKHLSKGLITHYSFSDPYIESTSNLLPSTIQNTYVTNSSEQGYFTIEGKSVMAIEGERNLTFSAYYSRWQDDSQKPALKFITLYSDGSTAERSQSLDDDVVPPNGKPVLITYNLSLDVSKTVDKITGYLYASTSGSNFNYRVENAQLEIKKKRYTPYTSSNRIGYISNNTGLTASVVTNDVESHVDTAIGYASGYFNGTTQFNFVNTKNDLTKSSFTISF